MLSLKRITTASFIIFFIISVLIPGAVNAGSKKLGVQFKWDGIRRCTGISPEIKVSDFPAATVSFDVRLMDLDAPDYNHGGGIVKNDGSGIIPKKALKPDFGLKNRYKGPCPPMGTHSYVFTVKALDADGKCLAEGKAMQPF